MYTNWWLVSLSPWLNVRPSRLILLLPTARKHWRRCRHYHRLRRHRAAPRSGQAAPTTSAHVIRVARKRLAHPQDDRTRVPSRPRQSQQEQVGPLTQQQQAATARTVLQCSRLQGSRRLARTTGAQHLLRKAAVVASKQTSNYSHLLFVVVATSRITRIINELRADPGLWDAFVVRLSVVMALTWLRWEQFRLLTCAVGTCCFAKTCADESEEVPRRAAPRT